MKIWGIPYNLASDSSGEILKLNIADVDKAAAVAAVIDAAIVGAVGVWGGSAEVMRLAARLGIELSLGLFIKGFAQVFKIVFGNWDDNYTGILEVQAIGSSLG